MQEVFGSEGVQTNNDDNKERESHCSVNGVRYNVQLILEQDECNPRKDTFGRLQLFRHDMGVRILHIYHVYRLIGGKLHGANELLDALIGWLARLNARNEISKKLFREGIAECALAKAVSGNV